MKQLDLDYLVCTAEFFGLTALGRIMKTSIAGDDQLTEAAASLRSSVDGYNAALGNISFRIVVKVYEILSGIASFPALSLTPYRNRGFQQPGQHHSRTHDGR